MRISYALTFLAMCATACPAVASPESVTVTPAEPDGIQHSGPTHAVVGRWYRGNHDGKHGWWWIVGRDWFYAKRPPLLAPELYTPPGEARGWWYLCPDNSAYYPFATRCLSRWVRVQPR